MKSAIEITLQMATACCDCGKFSQCAVCTVDHRDCRNDFSKHEIVSSRASKAAENYEEADPVLAIPSTKIRSLSLL